ncbi:MAG: tetratricopeptide repeat protein [Bacteroidota bacterium]
MLNAEVYFSKGDYANALKGYQEYLGDRKNADKAVVYRAGISAMNTGDSKTAIDLLKNSASASDSVGAYSSYYLGTLYLKGGQKPLAVTAFDVARKSMAIKHLRKRAGSSLQSCRTTWAGKTSPSPNLKNFRQPSRTAPAPRK